MATNQPGDTSARQTLAGIAAAVRQYGSLSELPCAGHPASAFPVDDAHVAPAALAAVRSYMDAAHTEYQAGRETRADG